jgi:hypothetical protein
MKHVPASMALLNVSCLLRCASGKYVDAATVASLDGESEGPPWDLKCKTMTVGGSATCQTEREADYDKANCQICQPGTYSDRRGATTNKCCAPGRSISLHLCLSRLHPYLSWLEVRYGAAVIAFMQRVHHGPRILTHTLIKQVAL